MVAHYYRDPGTGQFVVIPGPAVPPNQIVVQAAEPTDPNVKIWIDTDDDSGQTQGLPIGAVIAYAGIVLPPGWHLCDGSAHGSAALLSILGGANTPDLRDKFVVGTGSTHSRLTTGTFAATGTTKSYYALTYIIKKA